VPEPPLRIGLIGCGRAAESLHLPASRDVAGARVIAIADTARKRVDTVGASFGITRRHTDYHRVLDDAEVELVIVSVPPALSHGSGVRSADAAKHVLVEKPLALTLDACDRLVARATHSDRHVVVGFNLRSHHNVVGATAERPCDN
jgi:predicted dehydrogenase